MRRSLVSGLFALVLGVGCGPGLPGVYVDAHDTWTREEAVYHGFETSLKVRATLKTEAFRRAYVEAYGEIFALDPGTKARLLEMELADEQRALVILAAVYTPEYSMSNLTPSKGIWEVRLENGRGGVSRPTVRRINTRSPTWARLLPDLSTHEGLYELRFERITDDGTPFAKSGDTLELIIAGAPAHARLNWAVP